jgi:hypothetical protein
LIEPLAGFGETELARRTLQQSRGRLKVGDVLLTGGDGLSVRQTLALRLEGLESAEVLLFDLSDANASH